jgi:hypothetical protein
MLAFLHTSFSGKSELNIAEFPIYKTPFALSTVALMIFLRNNSCSLHIKLKRGDKQFQTDLKDENMMKT